MISAIGQYPLDKAAFVVSSPGNRLNLLRSAYYVRRLLDGELAGQRRRQIGQVVQRQRGVDRIDQLVPAETLVDDVRPGAERARNAHRAEQLRLERGRVQGRNADVADRDQIDALLPAGGEPLGSIAAQTRMSSALMPT